MTDVIITAKKAKGLTWAAIADKVGMGETWVASACLAMNSTSESVTKGLCEAL